MTEVSAVAQGFAALARARSEVTSLVSRDVSVFLPGRQLRAIATRLAGAATDARVGAEAIAGPAGLQARSDAMHAADLLEQATVIAGDRRTWNQERGSLLRVRDLIDDSLEAYRRPAGRAGRIDSELLPAPHSTVREPVSYVADEWDRLADLTELAPDARPQWLSHLTSGDVARMRDEAARLREGLEPRNERQLHSILQSIHVRSSLRGASDAEAQLGRYADDLIGGTANSSSLSRERAFRGIDALRRLGDDLRPGALDPSADADWIRAAELAGRGTMPGRSWDGWGQLRQMSASYRSKQVVDRLFAIAPQKWNGDQWREFANVLRTRVDVDPKLLDLLGPNAVDDVELVARRVQQGYGIPVGWDGATRLSGIRAAVLWGEEGQGAKRVAEILDAGIDQVKVDHLADLDAMRTLPDHLRPAGLDPSDTAWAEALRLRSANPRSAAMPVSTIDAFGKVAAAARWSDPSLATNRVVELIEQSPNLRAADLLDLHAMTMLPDGIRPSLIDAGDSTWRSATIARMGSSSRTIGAEALDGIARMRTKLFEDPQLARAALERIDTNFELLVEAQRRFGGNGEVPRAAVGRLRADIETLLALDPPDTERQLLERARDLANRNVRRMDREIVDSYTGHVDYADLGRIRESVRLASTLARVRMAEAVPGVPTAEAVADAASTTLAAAAGDTIVW